jgi:hypothetical protein
MKTLCLTIASLSVAVNCFAFPENLRPGTESAVFYDRNKECPLTYCENGDDGFSMRSWCQSHGGQPGKDPIIVGWAVVNGVSCFCGCNEAW